MNGHTKYKNLRLFKVFEIESDYKKHRDRLTRIKTGTTLVQQKKQRTSLVDHLLTFKKQKMMADLSKTRERDEKLERQNLMIHENLKKVYTRKTMVRSASKQSLRSAGSDRSLMQRRRKSIQQQNMKMSKKLANTRSFISKQKQLQDYRQDQSIRDRLTTSNSKRKQALRSLLVKKFNLKPCVLLPRVKDIKTPQASRRNSLGGTRSYHGGLIVG